MISGEQKRQGGYLVALLLPFCSHHYFLLHSFHVRVGGPFEKFVDWRQCSAVMQRGGDCYAKF
jgi:hypothetical protein